MNSKLQATLRAIREDASKKAATLMQAELKDLQDYTEHLMEEQFAMHVSLLNSIKANVDNDKLSDADFRRFVFNSLPLLEESK